jgi:glycosyltransferase involved in cell wall biosynthesis
MDAAGAKEGPRLNSLTSVTARVMHVVLSISAGGTERLVIEICRRLGASSAPVVCCLDGAGEWASELTSAGVAVEALNRQPGFRPSLGWHIARLAARHRVSVIHCHHYSPYVYGAVAKTLSPRIGLVYTEHGRLSDAAPSAKRRLVNPWLSRIPARVFAVSEELRRHMVAEGFSEKRVQVIYNGIAISPRVTPEERAAARAELGLPDDAVVVGSVARLDPVKNLSLLLQAHASLHASHPRARVALVGSGPEQQALETEARRLGTSQHVLFTGYRSDARRLMSAFDVYVNCSNYEGVSLTILEAMAAGLPVVATRVGGNAEVVIDGETGIIVPGREAAPLADAIATMSGDPRLRQEMGEAGRRRVEREFSIERMVDDYRKAYEACSR